MPYYDISTVQDVPVSTAQWQGAAHDVRWLRSRWDGVLLTASRQIAQDGWSGKAHVYRDLPALAPWCTIHAGIAWTASTNGSYSVEVYVSGQLVISVPIDATSSLSGVAITSSPLNVTTPGGVTEIIISGPSEVTIKGITLDLDTGDLWHTVPPNGTLATKVEWYRAAGVLNNLDRQYYLGTLMPYDLIIDATTYGSHESRIPLGIDPYVTGADYVLRAHAVAVDPRAGAKKVRGIWMGVTDNATGKGGDIELRSRQVEGDAYGTGRLSPIQVGAGSGDYASLDVKDIYYDVDLGVVRVIQSVSLELLPIYNPAGRANCAPTGPGVRITEGDLTSLWTAISNNLSILGPRVAIGGWRQGTIPIGGGTLDIGTFVVPLRDRYITDPNTHDIKVIMVINSATDQDVTVTITDIATGASGDKTISLLAGYQVVEVEFPGFSSSGDFQGLDIQVTTTGVCAVLGALVGLSGLH